MKDLWRLMTGFKGELRETKAELKADIADTKAELKGDIADVKAELKGDIADVRGDIADLKGETQAIREVVDTLASQEDFDSLDRKISAVSADTQATRQAVHDVKADLSRLRGDVKKAGIAVR